MINIIVFHVFIHIINILTRWYSTGIYSNECILQQYNHNEILFGKIKTHVKY